MMSEWKKIMVYTSLSFISNTDLCLGGLADCSAAEYSFATLTQGDKLEYEYRMHINFASLLHRMFFILLNNYMKATFYTHLFTYSTIYV